MPRPPGRRPPTSPERPAQGSSEAGTRDGFDAEPVECCTTPDQAKSSRHASIIRWRGSMSFESRVLATSSRPLIPPASLHHEVKTFAVSTNSEFLVNPMSENTPTSIESAVTPWAEAVEASPGPHTSLRSPKFAVATESDCPEPESISSAPSLPPHPVASTARAANATTTLCNFNIESFIRAVSGRADDSGYPRARKTPGRVDR